MSQKKKYFIFLRPRMICFKIDFDMNRIKRRGSLWYIDNQCYDVRTFVKKHVRSKRKRLNEKYSNLSILYRTRMQKYIVSKVPETLSTEIQIYFCEDYFDEVNFKISDRKLHGK